VFDHDIMNAGVDITNGRMHEGGANVLPAHHDSCKKSRRVDSILY
jgi:hypothetical protein